MRKMLGVMFFICSSSVLAGVNADEGLYVGGGISAAKSTAPTGTSFSGSLDNGSIYIRPVLGFRANNFLATEISYNDLADDDNSDYTSNGVHFGADHYRLYFADVSSKFIYPFEDGWSIFGKLGAAYVHQSVYNQQIVGMPPLIDSTTNNISPIVGGGVSFNFIKKVAVEFNTQYIPASGMINSITSAGFSINYTF